MPKKKPKMKMTRREMKKDPLVTFSLKAADFARSNARVLVIVAVIVVGSAMVAVMMTRDRARAESEAELVLDQANRELLRGNAADATTLYNELLDRYAGTSSGKRGLLFRGDALLQTGRYDEAIGSYERFLSREKKDEMLRNSARRGIATAFEDKGEFSKAAAAHENLAGMLEGNEAAAEFMSAARCYRAASMFGNAISLYERVISQFPDYWGLEEARISLEELRAKLRLAKPGSGSEGKGTAPQNR